MLKTLIFLVIVIIFLYVAASAFLANIEVVASERGRKLGIRTRDRLIVTGVLLAVVLLMSLMSHVMLLSTIVSLVIFAALIVANIYLKREGFDVLPSLCLFWACIAIAAQKNAELDVNSAWGIVYCVISFTLLVLLCAVSLRGDISRLLRENSKNLEKIRELRGEADRLQAEAEAKEEAETSNSEEAEEEADEEEAEGDEPEASEETDEEETDAEDPFHDEILAKVVRVGGFVLFFILMFILAYWLEVKFDFFPPYVN